MPGKQVIRLAFFFSALAAVAIWEVIAPRRALTDNKRRRWATNLSLVGSPMRNLSRPTRRRIWRGYDWPKRVPGAENAYPYPFTHSTVRSQVSVIM